MRANFLIAVLALVAYVTAKVDKKKIVCYFGSWAVYRPGNGLFEISDIDPTLCTHLVYTFIGIEENADVVILDRWADLPDGGGKNGYAIFNQLRGTSPDTRTLIAVGGWNQGSRNYSVVAADPALRVKLADNLVRFARKYGFDGLDFDWEYPNQREGSSKADRRNFVLLLRELRKRCDEAGLLLTAAVGGASSSAKKSYIIPEIVKYLDIVSLMIYDLHGEWDNKTGINAPFYPGSWETGDERLLNVNESINYWLSEGATREKLVLGIPTYGRTFTLKDPKNNRIGAPTTGPGRAGPYTREKSSLGYNEICEMQLNEEDWEVYFQEEQRVPYAVKGDQWVGYDNVKSVTEKAEFVKTLGLGGAMIWSIETDDFRGICGAKYPLLKTLNHILRNGQALPPLPTTTKAPPHAVEPQCTSAGYVRDFYDCAVFYHCMPDGNGGYNKFRLQCPNNKHFNEKNNSCDDPDKVDCVPIFY
ncbi:acidic mammalian chitinase-like [Copidosoma floridanum]|uniref:acidic mammalian chitinase-like n=1 Tax=Copidosoma floridanum TaxID=29053 RepID=UPI0006C9DC84|nr:acidic mammalian chitinase-like [Copidosoma floridanum]